MIDCFSASKEYTLFQVGGRGFGLVETTEILSTQLIHVCFDFWRFTSDSFQCLLTPCMIISITQIVKLSYKGQVNGAFTILELSSNQFNSHENMKFGII